MDVVLCIDMHRKKSTSSEGGERRGGLCESRLSILPIVRHEGREGEGGSLGID